jgi:hypothetical protein
MRWLVGVVCLSLMVAAQASQAQAQEAVSAELIKLHDDLHMSQSQEAAWKAYAGALAPTAQQQDRRRATVELMPLIPTPRRIALVEANMAQDEADFRREADAVMTFYNQLSADQQRTFDSRVQLRNFHCARK